MEEQNELILGETQLKDKIYVIRGVHVMLDADLAEIYGYKTKAFNQQVKNNIEKFDEEDLMFQLTKEEVKELSKSKFSTSKLENPNLKSKILTSSLEERNLHSVLPTLGDEYNLKSKITTSSWGGTRKLPYAFTEQGVYMLMTVLKGELATKQSKAIVRLFKKMKDYVIENQEILNHRDFLRLSFQTGENAQNIIEFRQKLTEIDDKVENVVSNLGDMVRKYDCVKARFA